MVSPSNLNTIANIENKPNQEEIITIGPIYCISANQIINNKNTLITNRFITRSPKKLIKDITYFQAICALDEDEAIIQLKYLLSKCSRTKIKIWLGKKFILNSSKIRYDPIKYAIYNKKIKIAKQLIESFNQSRYTIIGLTCDYYIGGSTHSRCNKLFNAYILKKSLTCRDSDLTTKLLDFYAKDNAVCIETYALLIIGAINNGQVTILQAALESYYNKYKKYINPAMVIQDTKVTDLRPMQLAIIKQNIQMVETLLKHKFAADIYFAKHNTFYLALKSCNLNIIKLLVNHGVDLNKFAFVELKYNDMCLLLKGIIIQSEEDYNKNKDVTYSSYPSRLEQAIGCSDIKTILWLIENGARSINLPPVRKGILLKFTPLHLAIFLNKPEIVALLLATKASTPEDKAWYSLFESNKHVERSINAIDYATRLNDGKDRSKILDILNSTISLSLLSELVLIKHYNENNLDKIKDYYRLPTKII